MDIIHVDFPNLAFSMVHVNHLNSCVLDSANLQTLLNIKTIFRPKVIFREKKDAVPCIYLLSPCNKLDMQNEHQLSP